MNRKATRIELLEEGDEFYLSEASAWLFQLCEHGKYYSNIELVADEIDHVVIIAVDNASIAWVEEVEEQYKQTTLGELEIGDVFHFSKSTHGDWEVYEKDEEVWAHRPHYGDAEKVNNKFHPDTPVYVEVE